SAGANATSYSWTAASPGTSYSFRVSAYNSNGDSAPSNVVSVTTPSAPAAPSGMTAVAVSSTRIDLAWTDNSSNEDGFKLFRSTDGVNWTWFATPAAGGTSYSWFGASPSTTYS